MLCDSAHAYIQTCIVHDFILIHKINAKPAVISYFYCRYFILLLCSATNEYR